ncbi:MAG: hypothetical protein K5880_02280 [Hydrogenophaga sp.]|uniref:hypothetical protein n=1 Tax=Hydrogenophaga sp. TaxID=1904254 RepID=UPI0026378DBF|nr:hypothetical protein [Hydrogenophaga sp.]MCV0437431.1 hypothetical protein [Hydrogenophaga sp.]
MMTPQAAASRWPKLVLPVALSLTLLACSSQEDREAKLIMSQIKNGCTQTGAPKAMCQCVVEEPRLIRSAKLLASNPSDEERRLTFVSQVHAQTIHCAESVLGIKPTNRELPPEAQRLFDQLVPRQ